MQALEKVHTLQIQCIRPPVPAQYVTAHSLRGQLPARCRSLAGAAFAGSCYHNTDAATSGPSVLTPWRSEAHSLRYRLRDVMLGWFIDFFDACL